MGRRILPGCIPLLFLAAPITIYIQVLLLQLLLVANVIGQNEVNFSAVTDFTINYNGTGDIRLGSLGPLTSINGALAENGFRSTLAFLGYNGDNNTGLSDSSGYSAISATIDKPSVQVRFVDDYGNSAFGAAAIDFLNRDPTLAVDYIQGPMNSAVTISAAGFASRYSLSQTSCISTSPLLSDKQQYPTLTRILPNDEDAARAITQAVYDLGYRRIVVIGSDDAFGFGQSEASILEANKLGMEVINRIQFPAVFTKSGEQDLQQTILYTVNILRGYIFIVCATGEQVQKVYELANDVECVGKGLLYIGGEWGVDSFFDDWPFAIENPLLVEGILSIRVSCDTASPLYQPFVEAYGSLSGGNKPNAYSCAYYDCTNQIMKSQLRTFAVMDALGVSRECLSHVYLIANVVACKGNETELINQMSADSKCNLTNQTANLQCTDCYRGVCEMLYLFTNGLAAIESTTIIQIFNIWQVYNLFNSYHLPTLSLLTGPVDLDYNGDRDINTVKWSVYNSQVNRTLLQQVSSASLPEGRRTKRSVVNDLVQFVNVGQLDYFNSVLAFNSPIFYPGGTISAPNLVQPADNLAITYLATPVWALVLFGFLTAITIFLIFGCLFGLRKYRSLLVIKSSSPYLMVLIAVGGIIALTGNLILLYSPNDSQASCVAFVWCKYIGFAITYGALFLKTYRVKELFNNRFNKHVKGKMSKQTNDLGSSRSSVKNVAKKISMNKSSHRSLKDSRLFLVLAVLVGIFAVYLILWTVLNDQFLVNTLVDERTNTREVICAPHGPWQWGMFAIEVFVLFLGVMLAYSVHRVPAYFNEAKLIAFCCYNWVICSILGQVVLVLVPPRLAIEYGLSICIIILQFVLTVSLLFGSKFYVIYQGKGNERDKVLDNSVRANSNSIMEGMVTNRNLERVEKSMSSSLDKYYTGRGATGSHILSQVGGTNQSLGGRSSNQINNNIASFSPRTPGSKSRTAYTSSDGSNSSNSKVSLKYSSSLHTFDEITADNLNVTDVASSGAGLERIHSKSDVEIEKSMCHQGMDFIPKQLSHLLESKLSEHKLGGPDDVGGKVLQQSNLSSDSVEEG